MLVPHKLVQALQVWLQRREEEVASATCMAAVLGLLCMLCCVAQENAELREQQSAAQEKSRKADARQMADACKQVCGFPGLRFSFN